MKKQSFLSQFSQPQAVFILLAWLRLIAAGFLLVFVFAVSRLPIAHIGHMVDWPLFLGTLFIVLVFSGLSFALRTHIFHSSQLWVVLVIDTLLWFVLIFASGGAINPAVSYLLVLLAVSALALSLIPACMLLAINGLLYAALLQYEPDTHHGHMLNWHLWGMWILFLMTAAILLAVIYLLGNALREKEQAIAEYREETVRNEQLVAMGTLAANIAHELGSPLSTISVLTEDLPGDDGKLLRKQIERCREALTQLKFADTGLYQPRAMASGQLLDQLQKEVLLLQPACDIAVDDRWQQPLLVSPLLKQALLALMNNAAAAAKSRVDCQLYCEAGQLLFDISHDGEPIAASLIHHLGKQRVEPVGDGLGIGYFLANASIERVGGQLLVSNLSQGGVLTRVLFNVHKMQAND